jgi:hypothetical protein
MNFQKAWLLNLSTVVFFCFSSISQTMDAKTSDLVDFGFFSGNNHFIYQSEVENEAIDYLCKNKEFEVFPIMTKPLVHAVASLSQQNKKMPSLMEIIDYITARKLKWKDILGNGPRSVDFYIWVAENYAAKDVSASTLKICESIFLAIELETWLPLPQQRPMARHSPQRPLERGGPSHQKPEP